jgi:hypothetical protein
MVKTSSKAVESVRDRRARIKTKIGVLRKPVRHRKSVRSIDDPPASQYRHRNSAQLRHGREEGAKREFRFTAIRIYQAARIWSRDRE